MPRRATVATESLWVPLAARCVCYACGVHFTSPAEKNHCRLCFDVFCHKCLVAKRLLPSHYGYTEPQTVCSSCNLLLTVFVVFASQIHRRGAGLVLPPRQAVIITGTNLPTPGGVASTSNSSTAETGFFRGLLRRLSSKSEAPPPPSDEKSNTSSSSSYSSFCTAPSASMCNRSLRASHAGWLYMVGWRPLNPNTALVVGSASSSTQVHISLKDIVQVSFGAASLPPVSGSTVADRPMGYRHSVAPSTTRPASSSTSATTTKYRHSVMPSTLQKHADERGYNDGRLNLELEGGFYCQVAVGVVQTVRGNGPCSLGDESDEEDGPPRGQQSDDDDEERIVDFTLDPAAALELADRLTSLLRHCRTHFAFSAAKMALHADMCPN